MIWKPRPVDLTRDEAIDLAKKELAPNWHRLTPQMAGVKTETGYVAYPLASDFLEKSWLIVFVDSTNYSIRTFSAYLEEWIERYNEHGLSILFVVFPTYRFCQSMENMRQLTDSESMRVPFVLDSDQSLSYAFSANVPPKFLLLHKGKNQFEYTDQKVLATTETKIQHFLRVEDPGLSLLPEFLPQAAVVHDTQRTEFGYGPRIGEEAYFGKPGFTPTSEGYRVGHFSHTLPEHVLDGQVVLGGEWKQNAERIETSDSKAFMSFLVEHQNCSIVAEALTSMAEVAMINIELNGVPVYDLIADEDMIFDDSGSSIVKVAGPRLYLLLKGAPGKKRHQLVLKFPTAKTVPIAIFGLRFGGALK